MRPGSDFASARRGEASSASDSHSDSAMNHGREAFRAPVATDGEEELEVTVSETEDNSLEQYHENVQLAQYRDSFASDAAASQARAPGTPDGARAHDMGTASKQASSSGAASDADG